MGASISSSRSETRIQREKQDIILEAALEVFASMGFRGSTIDQIADAAGMSKPNLLYYFSSKEDVHQTLIERLLEYWLAPLKKMRANGDPIVEIGAYIRRKLEMSRDSPRESRLFANEILQGAPHIIAMLEGELKALVNEKARIIQGWMDQGKLVQTNPHHLLFAIWATTQHYADFDVQVRAILGRRSEEEPGGKGEEEKHFEDAALFLENLFANGLLPRD
jgi:TetR/AcrR family transcriptional regulator